MEKQKKKGSNGITLIALVITIIIMLILAGVSINAIVGDNGILSRTQYSTFLSEMTAVEEAVQMWKAGEVIGAQGEDTKVIPVNGLCQVNDLTSSKRLAGEIGYYRIWNIKETTPPISIFSSNEDFNSAFEGEMIYYPAGVQDLYYLNNEAIGIKGDKTYVIDAATGMIYSMNGINLKGVSCYSANMATAVMSGNANMPIFAEAEVSGSNSGEKLAGNVQNEYLEDGSKNPDYNPNGFKIISSSFSNNVYKLYNTGDLYAKGVKGTQLNSSDVEMNTISSEKWNEMIIPTEIGSYKKVISGASTVYVIDNNDYLWAWGSNNSNKLGLTEEQQIEYTGRTPIQLNVDGRKVKEVWDVYNSVFVLTIDNKLYAAGENSYYELGLNDTEYGKPFREVDIPNPQNIKNILGSNEVGWIMIEFNDNKYYACGSNCSILVGNLNNKYTMFAPIFDGYHYKIKDNSVVRDESYSYNKVYDIDGDIKFIVGAQARNCYAILNNDELISISTNINNLRDKEYGIDVLQLTTTNYGIVCLLKNGKVYACDNITNTVGVSGRKEFEELILPNDLVASGIKEIFASDTTVFYLSNAGKIYVSSGDSRYLGATILKEGVFPLNDAPLMESLYDLPDNFRDNLKNSTRNITGVICFKGKDGKVYAIGDTSIRYRENILQSNWKKIAENVKDVSLGLDDSIAIIDKNMDVFIAGSNSRYLAQNTSDQQKVKQLKKLDNDKINGKVAQVSFADSLMYVLTIDGDLYGTGLWSENNLDNWPYGRFPGWEAEEDGEYENKYDLVLIKSNVNIFATDKSSTWARDKMLISNNKVYVWGQNFWKTITKGGWTPQELDFTGICDVSTITKIYPGFEMSAFITKGGKLYINGGKSNGSPNTGPIHFDSGDTFQDFSEKVNNEKIVDIAFASTQAAIFLTESGNVYGYGSEKYLGIGSTSGNVEKTIRKLPIENVSQITSGNGYFICVKTDGTVWGTGSNTFGVLGRWKGSPRASGRYRTAFNWVECPELEI